MSDPPLCFYFDPYLLIFPFSGVLNPSNNISEFMLMFDCVTIFLSFLVYLGSRMPLCPSSLDCPTSLDWPGSLVTSLIDFTFVSSLFIVCESVFLVMELY